jgi:hypothetical protein
MWARSCCKSHEELIDEPGAMPGSATLLQTASLLRLHKRRMPGGACRRIAYFPAVADSLSIQLARPGNGRQEAFIESIVAAGNCCRERGWHSDQTGRTANRPDGLVLGASFDVVDGFDDRRQRRRVRAQ